MSETRFNQTSLMLKKIFYFSEHESTLKFLFQKYISKLLSQKYEHKQERILTDKHK